MRDHQESYREQARFHLEKAQHNQKTCTWDDHLKHVGTVLKHIDNAGLTLSVAKCKWLGRGLIQPQVDKVEAIRNGPRPHNKKQCGADQSVATRRDVARGRATHYERAVLFLNTEERELSRDGLFGCPHAFLGNKQVQPRYEPSLYKKSKNLPPLSCCERNNGMTSP
ncbi:hypothetical protein SRHO_G00299820 [Serrasalmus rhombeus]